MIRLMLVPVLLLLTSSCYTVRSTCVTGGCYGPFEITIKTISGIRVEDVIVKLSHFSGVAHGIVPPTYGRAAIGNTDEKIWFPRGFIYKTDSDRLTLHLSIIHPDYKSLAMYASFPNQQGTIDLGEKHMLHAQTAKDQEIAKRTSEWEKQGLTESEIDEKLEGKGVHTVMNRLAKGSKYFPIVMAIGRDDIVDKYLPDMVREFIEHQHAAGKMLDKTFEDIYPIYIDAYTEKARRYRKRILP